MAENITFRTQLLGGVFEFCQNTSLKIFNNSLNLVELIVLLARYKEEGVRLCPKVYLTNNMPALVAMLPDGEKVTIGRTTQDTDGIKMVLKKCAPLAQDGWSIYIHDSDTSIEYGLFRGSSNPIAVLVDDVLMKDNGDIVVVKAFQIADECVEISANNGSHHNIFLNHRKEDSPPPLQYLDNLVQKIIDKIDEKEKESVNSFLRRMLFDALRQSHGCLIAVTNMNRAPKFLSDDGVILLNPVDFCRLVKDVKKGKILPAVLDNKSALVRGMTNTDGIILFDDKSKLIGYNCFIKLNQKDDVIGGARKRAFSILSTKIGKGLTAVFMQSQDGWSDYKGKN